MISTAIMRLCKCSVVSSVAIIVVIMATLRTSHGFTSNNITVQLDYDGLTPTFERINGSKVFRMHGKKGKEEKTWFDGREKRHEFCVLPTKCEKLTNSTCLGSQLPYTQTSLDLTDSYSQNQTRDRLEMYRTLIHVPKCWAVIQPFLCAVFLPKCEKIEQTEYLYMPSHEMCRITVEPCRLLYNTSYFPEFLKCNETRYPSRCNNDVREMKFNSTGQCMAPLIPADSSANYYRDIDGCGVQCKDPMYTDTEHKDMQTLIGWGAGICLFCNLFTVCTFWIDWQNANKYPGLIIFYINVCFAMVCIGWLAQFMPGAREGIVCRKDGTLRLSEPSAGENLSCVVVFVLVYYFTIAAAVWFVIFTYAWLMWILRSVQMMHKRIDKKGSYFHLVAWSLPLVLTITIMALSEVDANGVVGICFVGYNNQTMRFALLLGPIVTVIPIGGFFLTRGIAKLIKLISGNYGRSVRGSNKIRDTVVRVFLYMLFTLVFILATVVCHVHEMRNGPYWEASFRNYVICKISSRFVDNYEVCKMEQRPSVAVLQLHLLCLFGSGMLMSSWVWTRSTVEIWTRYVKRKMGLSVEGPMRLQRHKVIAQAWSKRKEFQDQGRLSISFHNSHTDPVGMNFNFDTTAASNDFSSTFAHNLPRIVNRRCALTGAFTSSSHNVSEISVSVRHVSVESRRSSIDSQVSVKIAEMKTKVTRGRSKGSHHNGGNSRSRHNRHKFHRKESLTSVESHSRIYKAAASKGKHSKRRSAFAGLDPLQLNALVGYNNKLLQTADMRNSSEDDNDELNSTSVRVKNFDLCLKRRINVPAGYAAAAAGDHNDDDHLAEEHATELDRLMVRRTHADTVINTTDDEKMTMSTQLTTGLDSVAPIKRYIEGVMRNGNETGSSKASTKTRTSGKSQRSRKSSSKRRKKAKSKELVEVKKETSFYNSEYGDSSVSSAYSLDFGHVDLMTALGALNSSSYSGVSKTTTSRNSKRSCDVGIQANAHEIAASNGHRDDDHNSDVIGGDDGDGDDSDRDVNNKHRHSTDDSDAEEEDALMVHRRVVATTVAVHHGRSATLRNPSRVDQLLSDADKLKMLLLP